MKIINNVFRLLKNFFAHGKSMVGLPGIKLVFPDSLPAAALDIKLVDPVTDSELPFNNSAEIEIVLAYSVDGKQSVNLQLDDMITSEDMQTILDGKPIIARVTHLYEITSIQQK